MSADVDVAVVGAGAIGTAIAWRLAQRGQRVLLIDRLAPGQEASGAAAGILSAQVEAEVPGPFLDLLLAAENAYPALMNELGAADEVGYRRDGVLKLALDESEFLALEAQRELQRSLGLVVEAWSVAQLARAEPGLSGSLAGANFFPGGGRVDNRLLVAALLRAALRAGVELLSAEVVGLARASDRVTGIVTAGGLRRAGQVVVAAGAWASQLQHVGLEASAIVPVRGQVLRFPVPTVSRVVFGAGGYLVPRAGGVLVGSTTERVGFRKEVTVEGRAALHARAVRLCPALAGASVEAAWAGLRPATADGLPALGPTPLPGLHLAVGLLRNGILLTPLASDWVALGVLGEAAALPAPFRAARLFR